MFNFFGIFILVYSIIVLSSFIAKNLDCDDLIRTINRQ